MEKDDKIKLQNTRSQRIVWMAIASIFVVGSIVVFRGSNAVSSPQEALKNEHAVHRLVRSETEGSSTRHEERAAGTSNVISQQTRRERLADLVEQYNRLDSQVRAIKKTGVIMETDPESLRVTSELQEVARQLVVAKYGPGPYRVRVDLEFPNTIPDFDEVGKHGSLVLELAPLHLIPVSVYTFLEVARTWVRGAFHRNAGHVLQVRVESRAIKQHLPFQEYSSEFPHVKGTTGYCGRPSGPCWYVSIQDNTVNHGPGSQQKKNPYEADANFGRVVQGMEDVVPRIHSIPQRGWLDQPNQIKITHKTILVPDGQGSFREWKDVDEVVG